MDDRKDAVLDVIRERSSYRGRYKDVRVPREDLVRILEAGLAAPSGCNRQTTSLVAVDDPALLREVLDSIDPPACGTAPALICVLTRRAPASRGRCYDVQDYSAAIENMLLAIKALGYDSCWYEGHVAENDAMAEGLAGMLGVPDGLRLVCLLPVGHAADEVTKPDKKAFDERAWFNRRGDGTHPRRAEGA